MLGLVVNQAHRFTSQGAFLTFSKYIFAYIFWDRASLVAELIKNLTAMQEIPFDSWVGKIHWRRDRLPTPVFLGFPGKESACNVGDLGSIPGLGRFPWRRERLPTPVFWSGEFHGLYSPWSLKESDMTE